MDLLTFFSKLAEAFAWPAVVLFAILIFRKKLNDVLKNLKISQVKYGDAELNFGLEATTERVVAEKLEVKRALVTEDLSPEQRTEATARLENLVRDEVALKNYQQFFSRTFRGVEVSKGREFVLKEIIKNNIGVRKAATASEQALAEIFRIAVENVRPAELNGLRNVEIIDARNQLTELGVGLVRTIAKEMLEEE